MLSSGQMTTAASTFLSLSSVAFLQKRPRKRNFVMLMILTRSPACLSLSSVARLPPSLPPSLLPSLLVVTTCHLPDMELFASLSFPGPVVRCVRSVPWVAAGGWLLTAAGCSIARLMMPESAADVRPPARPSVRPPCHHCCASAFCPAAAVGGPSSSVSLLESCA